MFWCLKDIYSRNEWADSDDSESTKISFKHQIRVDLALIETLLSSDNSFSQYDNSGILDAAFTVTSRSFDDSLLVW